MDRKTVTDRTPIVYKQLFIGGKWIAPSGSSILEIRSPHDQSLVGTTVEATNADIDIAIGIARKAFDEGPWPRLNPEERQKVVSRFIEVYSERAAELAQLVTAENGTPLWFTNATADAVLAYTEAYLKTAKNYTWEEIKTTTEGKQNRVCNEPVGVVAIVVPWNSPQPLTLIKIIPALLAGCTMIIKPSSPTPLDCIALGEIFAEAGVPEGVISILPARRIAGEYLISRPEIDKIAFTGSTAAGQKIASIGGSQIKRITLELGGKSAAILLEDADIDAAVAALKYNSFCANGEFCMAQTRILAHSSRYQEVVNAFTSLAEGLKIGNPADPETFIGPLVNKAQYDRVISYIELGLSEGARLITGGADFPKGKELENGFYVKPTVFADVNNKMRIAQEEIFGPVLVIIPFETLEEAIGIANDSDYGLSGSVWSSDIDKALDVAKGVRTGMFGVNYAGLPDLNSPSGGYKKSGVGRELGVTGLENYIEKKTITIG